ncbi:MarR family winged helix-turn-helix transcriptional regulator [Leisingera sp. ANG-M7]|uniref:MarR family winged helix-turn-helix transcriptional regulator n=1 Tax=Leisingera sp. ANG-M7 TaxID=1577902 RepID=UPI00057F6FC6|nr:MarR family transcriptional regulator [Leisingera sp. ANG-M7]KIC35414.1 MarR family transcriptional regulator [Leisingera sp. ANG-M7]
MSDFQKSSAGFLANHMARLFAAALAGQVQPLGLAPAQFMVLLELWAREGRTQAELTAALSVEQATMANTLARMERDGLIERRPSPEDKRARLVHLTAKARGLQQEAITAAQGVNRQALEGFSAEEAAQFLAQMRRVIANLQRTRR